LATYRHPSKKKRRGNNHLSFKGEEGEGFISKKRAPSIDGKRKLAKPIGLGKEVLRRQGNRMLEKKNSLKLHSRDDAQPAGGRKKRKKQDQWVKK